MVGSEDDGSVRRRALSPILGADDFRPLSASVQVEVAGRTHRGKVRPINPDHYLVIRLSRDQETLLSSLAKADLPQKFREYGYVMLVADGLGEAGSGAVASRLTRRIRQLVLDFRTVLGCDAQAQHLRGDRQRDP